MKILGTRIGLSTDRESDLGPMRQERLGFKSAGDAPSLFTKQFVSSGSMVKITSRDGLGRWGELPPLGRIVLREMTLRSKRVVKEAVNTADEGALGLYAIAIPTPEGELSQLVRAYKDDLGCAAGQRVLWETIDDPRFCDAVFRQQCVPEPKTHIQAQVARFLAAIKEAGSKESFVSGEYLRLIQHLGIQPSELPLILFVALEPVFSFATLCLTVDMLETASRRKRLMDLFRQHLSEEVLLRYAHGDRFTLASMQELQGYLNFLEPVIAASVESTSDEPARTMASDFLDRYLGNEGIATTAAFAYSMGADRKRTPLSQEQYEAIIRDRDQMDFILDGYGLRSYSRKPGAAKHLEHSLSRNDYALIRDFMVHTGFHHPTRFYYEGASDGAARHAFHVARRKVDIREGRYSTLLFRLRRGGPGESSVYAFAPDEDVKWLLIEPGDA